MPPNPSAGSRKPEDAGLHSNISMVLPEGRYYADACGRPERALAADPDLWRTGEAASRDIATVSHRYGRKDAAIGSQEQALALNPDYEKAKKLLQEIDAGN